jgi:phage shock protein PspC (stress-responsive transcriptional regulator)
MDKTININIAGVLFKIDEDAYQILRDYLQAINTRFRNVAGGSETIEDIESRIAEIFQSQKGLAGVITRENVDNMISVIGSPDDFDTPGEETTPPLHSYQRKRMYRNPDDSIIGGVCGGIGAYLNSDPVLFRILFVILAFSGLGFIVYAALWIAIPGANTEAKKREMYGKAYNSARSFNSHYDEPGSMDAPIYNSGYYNTSRIGNAFNEIFRAIGRVSFIILRIILIIIGGSFVLTGFLFILSFIMVFVFRFPGSFATDAFDLNLIFVPDFLSYIVTPSLAPWIITLTVIAVIMPLLAFIYWGVKMIFWFRANDGVLSLAALVIWVLSIATLSIMLFSEGISFAETSKSSYQYSIPHISDTLYIKAGKKVSDLNFEKELTLKEECYSVYLKGITDEIFINPFLRISRSDDSKAAINIKKRSSGHTEAEALRKTKDLQYEYSIVADTLFLDEYFTIPAGRKWAADNVGINLHLPEGTTIIFENILEDHLLLRKNNGHDELNSDEYRGNRLWVITEDGPELMMKNP